MNAMLIKKQSKTIVACLGNARATQLRARRAYWVSNLPSRTSMRPGNDAAVLVMHFPSLPRLHLQRNMKHPEQVSEIHLISKL